VSRRFFLQCAGAAGVAANGGPAAAQALPDQASSAGLAAGSGAVTLHVNGQTHRLALEPRVTLLDALRDTIGLTGTKKGCDRGQCGACTVLLDGRRVNACLTLAIMAEGAEVTTIEGLGRPEALHPVQAAFIEHDGFQCGYCTPGQICSAVAMLGEAQAGHASAVTADVRRPLANLSDDEIRERMSSNLCRCGAYPNIVTALRAVIAGKPAKVDALPTFAPEAWPANPRDGRVA